MCVIVDTNRAHAFFSAPFSGDFAPVGKWINDRDGRLVYGGKLKDELAKLDKARRLIAEWKRSGRAIELGDDTVSAEQDMVNSCGLCRSNDQHISALARCSGARVLCTDDRLLMADFQN